MRILICGAGITGLHVARVLADVHDVVLVDLADRSDAAQEAGAEFVAGDAADPVVLMRAGAREADAVIALTHADTTNLLIALLAKRRLGVRTTLARISDPAHRWLFTPEAGVDIAISTAELVTRVVQEEVTAGDLVTLLRLRGPGIAVLEVTVPPGAAVAGTRATEMPLPDGVAITAIARGGELLLPERAGPITAGDSVVTLCEPGREHLLHDLLTAGAEARRARPGRAATRRDAPS